MFCESVTHNYLILLGIRQACRFQGKSFLKFLMSGEKDVAQFRAARRLKVPTQVGRQEASESNEQAQVNEEA